MIRPFETIGAVLLAIGVAAIIIATYHIMTATAVSWPREATTLLASGVAALVARFSWRTPKE